MSILFLPEKGLQMLTTCSNTSLTSMFPGIDPDPYPGLHLKQHGQQVKGDDSTPLLCSGETSPRVQHPALGPSAQEGQGSIKVGPEKGHKDDQKAETPLL